MSSTYCVTRFDRAVQALPVFSVPEVRALINAQPKTCDRPDCSPGGCRKHVIDYASGVVFRHQHQKPAPIQRGKTK